MIYKGVFTAIFHKDHTKQSRGKTHQNREKVESRPSLITSWGYFSNPLKLGCQITGNSPLDKDLLVLGTLHSNFLQHVKRAIQVHLCSFILSHKLSHSQLSISMLPSLGSISQNEEHQWGRHGNKKFSVELLIDKVMKLNEPGPRTSPISFQIPYAFVLKPDRVIRYMLTCSLFCDYLNMKNNVWCQHNWGIWSPLLCSGYLESPLCDRNGE